MEVTQRRPIGGNIGRWTSTRRGTFAVALIATVIAAAILLVAASRYRHSVVATTKPATVLVATRLIEQGTSGATIGVGRYFRPEKILSKQVSQGAFADTAQLHGRIADTDIYPGQQLTAADFVGGGEIASRLAPAQRAISIPLTTSHGLVGDIHTGDRVDVYVTFPSRANGLPPALRLVAPNIVVLKAGESSSQGGIGASADSATATANVVLEVGSHQAAEIALGVDVGKVWLVQRPSDGTRAGEEIISEASILAGNSEGPAGGTK
jgi:Flp pilus assembly protein CpaB